MIAPLRRKDCSMATDSIEQAIEHISETEASSIAFGVARVVALPLGLSEGRGASADFTC